MDPATADGGTPAESGNALDALTEQFSAFRRSGKQVTRRKLDLVATEGRLAATSLVQMIVAGLLALLVVTAAWTMLCLSAGWFLLALDWPMPAVLLTVAIVNLIFAALLGIGIRQLSRNLTFQASRRNLL